MGGLVILIIFDTTYTNNRTANNDSQQVKRSYIYLKFQDIVKNSV